MARLGYEKSTLLVRMERATGVVEAWERVEHAAPAPLLEIKVMTVVNGEDTPTSCIVNRGKLLAFLAKELEEAVEAAHRVMHGVTGD